MIEPNLEPHLKNDMIPIFFIKSGGQKESNALLVFDDKTPTMLL